MTTELSNIAYIEKDGQILFSAEEIGRQLGYSNPKQSVANLFNRNYQELLIYSVEIKLISTDGKAYNKRHFTEEGVYILSMLANTEQARDFRRRVAELLKTLRQAKIKEIENKAYADAKAFLMHQVSEIEDHAYNKGRQAGFRADNWRKMEKAVKLLKKGLPLADAAKIIGCKPDTIRERLQRLGVLEKDRNDTQFSKNNPNNLTQGSLL